MCILKRYSGPGNVVPHIRIYHTVVLPCWGGLTKTCKTTQTDYKAMQDKDCICKFRDLLWNNTKYDDV